MASKIDRALVMSIFSEGPVPVVLEDGTCLTALNGLLMPMRVFCAALALVLEGCGEASNDQTSTTVDELYLLWAKHPVPSGCTLNIQDPFQTCFAMVRQLIRRLSKEEDPHAALREMIRDFEDEYAQAWMEAR